MTPEQARAALVGGQVTVAQVLADLPKLIDQRVDVLRAVAEALAAAADEIRGEGQIDERLVAAQLHATVALRSMPGGDPGPVLDLMLAVLHKVESD